MHTITQRKWVIMDKDRKFIGRGANSIRFTLSSIRGKDLSSIRSYRSKKTAENALENVVLYYTAEVFDFFTARYSGTRPKNMLGGFREFDEYVKTQLEAVPVIIETKLSIDKGVNL